MSYSDIQNQLGADASTLLDHKCETIDKSMLHLPGGDFVNRIFKDSNRNNQVLRSLEDLYSHGRLGGTGYLSILPVDQGIEHSGGASFAPNPIYFDPENIIKLAIEAECNAVASTFGVLASMSRKYAHKIPFVVKINHNETLSLPAQYDQTMYGSVEDAWNNYLLWCSRI
jgi:class I fructose-bisphosphate aldolase